jgi:hypothetical protein
MWSPSVQRAVDAALTRMGFVAPTGSERRSDP